MESAANLFKFSELCAVLELIKRQTKPADKRNVLRKYIEKYKTRSKENQNLNPSFYSVLRLILPQYDRDRGPFGIKVFKFAKVITEILCLPPKSPEAMQLANYKNSTSVNVSDFADAAYWVLRRYFNKNTDMTVAEVNGYLDNLAQRNAENDPRGVENEMMNLFKACGNADNQKWLIRIILKELRLGMGNDSILATFHRDAVDLYSNTNSLIRVCEVLHDSSKQLHEIEVSIFTPFRPMLSKRCDANEFNKRIRNDALFFVENKFDGERFQIHMNNGVFKYFSRNGFEYTDTYGEDYTKGFYTPLLKGVFKEEVKNFILDGEMMGWNKYTKEFGSKGMNFDVKKLKMHNTHQPCFCAFDIVLFNDEVLTNQPMNNRKDLLKKIIRPKEGVLVVSTIMETHCKEDIIDALNLSMDKKEEGIVFKDPNSIYKPNDRNSGWWKLKLEYFEGVMTDLDVIILGGNYGEGRYRTMITGFLVGILSDTNKDKKEFISFATISSGLSDEELQSLHRKIGQYWMSDDFHKAKDFGVLWGKEKPNVWIKPENSCILTVRASELTRSVSSGFLSKYTLRFPRILKIRDDKLYYECLTTKELDDLTTDNKSVVKLSGSHISLGDIENVQQKTRKKRKLYIEPEIVDVEQKTTILEGHEFCVLTGSTDWKKADIEIRIKENGGSVVFTETDNTLCMLVGDYHPRIDFLKDTRAGIDIVKVDWLKNVLELGIFYRYKPEDTLYTCERSRLRFKQFFDKYKDSYSQFANEQSFMALVKEIEDTKDYVNAFSLDLHSAGIEIPNHLFPDLVAYFDAHKIINDTTSGEIYDARLDKIDFQFYGGVVSEFLTKDVNLVVLGKESRREEVQSYIEVFRNNGIKIVINDFIQNAVKNIVFE